MSSADSIREVLELHRTLVEIPSLSREEGPAMDFAQRYVEERGLVVRRYEDNLWFGLGDGPDRLLLATHLDVVPPSADHPFPPFEATLHDGRIFGRGTVDAKASAAAMTTAVLELARAGFEPSGGQVLVALTACEEIGGAYNGLEQLRKHSLPPISAALVGEPTRMRPCVSQKGLLILHVVAHGRTAHAARAHLGDNALYRAARDLLRLEAFTFDRADPYLGSPTLVAAVVQGGTAHNVVPDRCEITVDIRTTPVYTPDEIVELLRAELESEVRVHSDRLVSVGTSPDARIVQACRTALPDAEPFGSPTMSDWVFLRDVEAVKIGPGRSELSHTPEEHITPEEVAEAVDAYKRIIRAYFADKGDAA